MAFVFRSERNFDYQKEPNKDSSFTLNDKNIQKFNDEIITKLRKKKEKRNQLNNDKHTNNNSEISNSVNIPFFSTSEKAIINSKDETPGPGAYNINKLFFNRHKQFSLREGFSDTNEFDFFNLPSIRLKEVPNNNPGPGQYYPNERDLFGGKFKKIYNTKINNKFRTLSKSARDIFIKKKNDKKINDSNNNFDDMKDIIQVSSSGVKRVKTKDNTINNIETKNPSYNSSLILNKRQPSTFRNNESEMYIRNKKRKNISRISGASLDTQRSSLNSSHLTLTNQRNPSSKILIPKLDNSELYKYFNSNNNSNVINIENNKNFSLHTIDKDDTKNNFSQVIQFKYDKSRIIKNSQDHDRIMSMNESKNIFSDKFNEFLLEQELFSQNPGPGYYDPIEPVHQKYFFKKDMINLRKKEGGSVLPPHKYLKKISSSGPGEYKIDPNSIENKLKAKNDKNKIKSGFFDIKKIAKLRIAQEKASKERNAKLKLLNSMSNQFKITYDNNNKEINENNNIEYRKKKLNNLLYNFGSNDKRFKIPKQKIPGVGEYELNIYKSIEQKNANIVQNPSYNELLKKLENKSELLERAPLNKDLVNNPPVGGYDPDIISSIKYNIDFKNQMKNQIQTKKTGFNETVEQEVLQRAKEIKEKEKQLIDFLGPGKYFNLLNSAFNIEKNKNNQNINAPFGSSSKDKFENNRQDLTPGPGQYNINSYYNWLTRTYNVLFY